MKLLLDSRCVYPSNIFLHIHLHLYFPKKTRTKNLLHPQRGPSTEGWEPDKLRNKVGFSWSYQNCLGLSLDFLGPIGFVAANLAANWPQAALVKRDVNPAKTAL